MFKPIGYALVFALTIVGCGKAKKNSATPAFQQLIGHVQDSKAAPVAGAKLSFVDKRAEAQTDGAGAFNLNLPTGHATDAVLTIEAPGFVTRTIRLSLPESGAADETLIALREVDMAHTITVPAAGQPPVTVATTRVDGGATLSIPSGALVDAAGQPVVGDAEVAFTYFHPGEGSDGRPVALFSMDSNTGIVERLKTFGMIDVEISQQGNLLSVAQNAHLGLNFKVPPALQAMADDPNNGPNYKPKLFSANTTTGRWELEADLDTEDLYFDKHLGEYVARLHHMSSWNLDSTVGTGVKACIKGLVQIRTPDGSIKIAPNERTKVWFADRDQVVMFDTTTDSAGQYCIDVAMRADGLQAEVNYFVTGSQGANDGSMCNPLPTFCSTCRLNDGDYFCSFCGLRSNDICDYGQKWGNGDIMFDTRADGKPNGCRPRPQCTTNSSEQELTTQCKGGRTEAFLYQETCSPSSRVVALQPGPTCGLNLDRCQVLDTVTIDRSGLPTPLPSSPQTPVTPTPTKPETMLCDDANPRTKKLGQACIPNVDQCCPTSAGLLCSDYVCVPPVR